MGLASRSSFALAVLLMAHPGLVAADTLANPPAVFGYFDPATRVFTPAPQDFAPQSSPSLAAPRTAAAPIVRSGTVAITVTVHIVSPIPTNATFYTGATIAVSDPATAPPPSYSSSANAFNPTVTRSGAIVTVKASIPYRFVYTTAADQMVVTFYISYQGGTYPRFSYDQQIPVPANGATTSFALAAAL